MCLEKDLIRLGVGGAEVRGARRAEQDSLHATDPADQLVLGRCERHDSQVVLVSKALAAG